MKKRCTKCKRPKGLGEFSLRPGSTQPRSQCKPCRSKGTIAARDPEKFKQTQHIWYLKNKLGLHRRFINSKSRFKDKWHLTEDEFTKLLSHPSCHYCHEPVISTGTGLDRLDPKVDYIITNVVPCCDTCNDIKGKNLTPQEMCVAMDAIIAFRRSRCG